MTDGHVWVFVCVSLPWFQGSAREGADCLCGGSCLMRASICAGLIPSERRNAHTEPWRGAGGGAGRPGSSAGGAVFRMAGGEREGMLSDGDAMLQGMPPLMHYGGNSHGHSSGVMAGLAAGSGGYGEFGASQAMPDPRHHQALEVGRGNGGWEAAGMGPSDGGGYWTHTEKDVSGTRVDLDCGDLAVLPKPGPQWSLSYHPYYHLCCHLYYCQATSYHLYLPSLLPSLLLPDYHPYQTRTIQSTLPVEFQ